MIGLALAQLSFFLTTIYLHRTLAHRALKLSPGVVVRLPSPDLGGDGHTPTAVGSRASQAPRFCRPTGRSALTIRVRIRGCAVRKRRTLPKGGPRLYGRRPIRTGNRAGSMGPLALRSSTSRPRHRRERSHPRSGVGARVDCGWRLRGHLSTRRRHCQRRRALVGKAPTRQSGDEQPMARLARGGGGPSQQSSRSHHFAPPLLRQRGVRPRMVDGSPTGGSSSGGASQPSGHPKILLGFRRRAGPDLLPVVEACAKPRACGRTEP